MIILWTLAEAERVAKVRSALDRDTLVCVWYCGSGYCCGHTEEGGSTWTKITAYLAGEWTFRNRSFYDIGEAETVPVITEYLEDGTKVYRQQKRPLGGGAVATLQREAEKMAGHGGGT